TKGYQSTLSLPVVSGDRVVAAVTFSRKLSRGAFTPEDEPRLSRIPISAALRMVLHYEEVKDLEFALGLVTKIASGPQSPDFIAQTLTKEMATHYEWPSVIIFRPDEQDRQFALVSQEPFRLPADWRHPIDKGVTGHVFRTREPLNVT